MTLRQTHILEAEVKFVEQELIQPLVLSGGVIKRLTEAQVKVVVKIGSRKATGRGSIYLSDLWAWPDPVLSHEKRDAALREDCGWIARNLWQACGQEPAHPLELGMRLHQAVCHSTDASLQSPLLARAMCASPFDAAIHDAAGEAMECSAFAFYREPMKLPSVDAYFENQDACGAIDRLIKTPRQTLPAWLIVSKTDDLQTTMKAQVHARGYTCFKLKITGTDPQTDAVRTASVFEAARTFGVQNPILSVDSNEANPDPQSVLDYLDCLKTSNSHAYDALQYLEQPTARDIKAHPFDWRQVSKRKPVLLDEGLTGLDRLALAVEQGWSGFALKTCKGHSFVLVAGAWAKERNLVISLQDLTNPGLSMIHAALLASHVPMLNGVELNSPQYTPAANEAWLPRLSGLFEPNQGQHHLPEILPLGLGSAL